MTVEVTVDVADRRTLVLNDVIRNLIDGPTRDAVNASALIEVTDARRRVQQAIGAEQRLSGVTSTQRAAKGGGYRKAKLRAETRAKGGARINPYYREALADENPTALIGVRGAAHFIEHRRKGGYQIRPAKAATAGEAFNVGELLQRHMGFTDDQAARAAARLHRPALAIGYVSEASPKGLYGGARGGAIISPLAPITTAFAMAAATVEDTARDALEASLAQSARNVGAGLRTTGRATTRLARAA